MARRELSRGEQYMARRQFASAAKSFDRAISYAPDSAQAHAGLGQIREMEGELREAVTHYQAAIKSAPERSDYALALGDALRKSAVTSMQRGELLEAALRAYRHALSLDDRCSRAAMGMGLCYRLIGQIDRAVVAFQHAQRLDPSSAEAHAQLASLYESRAQDEKALAEYRIALRLNPESARLHNAFAALNLKLIGARSAQSTLARQRAIAHYRKSLEIDPDQPQVRRRVSELDPASRTAVTAAPRETE